MKISRLKVFVLLLIVTSFFTLSINDVIEIFDVYTSSASRIVISGAVNDASTFAFAWSMFVMSILMMLCLLTGKKLLWMPKLVLIFMAAITIIAFFLGWGMNVMLKEKLSENNYIECPSERELTLKYSSRTYVLDPSLCNE